MNTLNLPEDSDTSDDDYIPGGKPEEVVSEIDSDGDPEDEQLEIEDVGKKNRKRTKHIMKSTKKQKKMECVPSSKCTDEGSKQLTEEEKKKIEEDVWADFMKDTGFQSKKNMSETVAIDKMKPTTLKSSSDKKLNQVKKTTEKVKITQVFEFAGEEIEVEKEVAADSAEARLCNKPTLETTKICKGSGKSGLSGISNVLSQLGKKPKISTLEKSKLDWDKFKKEENLEEELQTHNKGKDGYLERQDFLQRADLRRFEIEKEIRTIERSKRMNTSL